MMVSFFTFGMDTMCWRLYLLFSKQPAALITCYQLPVTYMRLLGRHTYVCAIQLKSENTYLGKLYKYKAKATFIVLRLVFVVY